ncbi:MAG: hypothetical protein HZB26_00595 [Candidatus Hydrogenedentes bacterium]|nr:hypothetical protein [Candidatus Hydrogenedentota bacterium]
MQRELNVNDVLRFLASKEGQRRMKQTEDLLTKKKIMKVTFSNEGSCVGTTLHLSDGSTFLVYQPSLIVHALPNPLVEKE